MPKLSCFPLLYCSLLGVGSTSEFHQQGYCQNLWETFRGGVTICEPKSIWLFYNQRWVLQIKKSFAIDSVSRQFLDLKNGTETKERHYIHSALKTFKCSLVIMWSTFNRYFLPGKKQCLNLTIVKSRRI